MDAVGIGPWFETRRKRDAPHHQGSRKAHRHLFRKFSGRPDRGQSIAINSPLPDRVMYAVFSSGPPKAMLVVTRSPVGTCSTNVPSGAITEMQPDTSVATQMLPPASTASESNIW